MKANPKKKSNIADQKNDDLIPETLVEKELKLLTTIIEFSQEQLSFTEALYLYLEAVSSLFDANFSLIYLRKKNEDYLFPSEIRYTTYTPFPKIVSDSLTEIDRLPEDSVPAQVLATGQRYLWTLGRNNTSPIRAQLAKSLNMVGSVSIPISRFGKVIAVAEFGLSSWQYATDASIDRACSAAIQIGVTLERRKAQKSLQQNFHNLKEAHDELKLAQQQLIQAEKMASIGLLSAGIAHEINNPIGFIKSNIESLGEYTEIFLTLIAQQKSIINKLAPEQKPVIIKELQDLNNYQEEKQVNFLTDDVSSLINDSKSGILRIINIVKGLQVFSHAGDQISGLHNINESVENSINIIWNQIKQNVSLKMELGELPDIYCNLGQLSQVFMNLLINASHAIDNTGEIIVSTFVENEKIIISVVDNGKGMKESTLQKIFDPFYTTKPAGIGTGLGLSISFGIIQRHGGDIKVTSKYQEGTEFRVQLPLNH